MTETGKRYTNQEVAQQLRLIGDMMQIKGENRFRVLAFKNAAESIENHGQDLYSIQEQGALTDLPNVGKGIATDIEQLLDNGQIEVLEKLKEEVPVGVVEMMRVPDMGPKKAARLWQELDITSIEALKIAAQEQQLRGLKGFGAKSEEKILKGITLLENRSDDRIPLGVARPTMLDLMAGLESVMPDGALTKVAAAGSLRRWKESVGDLDLLAVSPEPDIIMDGFKTLPQVVDVVVGGQTKTRVRLTNGLECDLRVVEARHWGAALQYFTGSKEHNVALRELAQKQGWSLNEYGLTATGRGDDAQGEERFFETEEALYAFLGLDLVPPELREDRGEIQAAATHQMPFLLELADIQGELHGHTTWSDGKLSIAEMAEAARTRGYRYWNVSDHSVGLGITGGVDAAKLAKQRREIDLLNAQWQLGGDEFRLLLGSEVEVLADGSLGLADEILATLDVVVGSIHSSLRQDRNTITERCLQVVRNPHVDILGHPTGRLLGRRPPTELDVEQVLVACAETGTVVEINAHPSRLDLNDVYARRAVELGCKIAINTDAHSAADMDLMIYGIGTARRAWLNADDIVNTRSLDKMLACLKDRQ